MRQRLWYLAKAYGLLVLTFMAAKLAFMFFNREGHDVSMGDVASVIYHGASLDLSTALYFLIIPFLLVFVSVWWNREKVLRPIARTYNYIIATAFSLAFLADTSLYPFWGFKLDASCLQFLSTPGDAFASVDMGYVLIRLIILVVLAGLIGYLLNRADLKFKVCRHRWLTTIAMLVLLPLMIVGIRGGLDESTTNIGQVYYSQNQFLNHSAVNPVFSFLASFEKTASDNTDYQFMSDEECRNTLKGCFVTGATTDTLLTTQTPNIIVILMESAGGEFTELSGRADIMPNLNRLCREGIYFTNCYANSWRTDRGTLCTWSGYPSFPTTSVMKMPSKTQQLPNIARTLRDERDYSTHYLYGGDINFTNMRSYLVSGGFQQLTWKADYSSEEQRSANWGVRDDITFNTLLRLTATMQQPFLIGYSTLSSHEPWDVPIQQFDDEVLNAFYYLDQCIGDFITKLKQSAIWKNTLVVLLPDHGINYRDIDETHPLHNHIPLLWLGGAVKEPHTVEVLCNQTDLAATLLAQLGLDHSAFTFSRNVLSHDYPYPFAYHTFNNGFSLVDSTGFMVYDLNSMQPIVRQTNDVDRLERLGKALLQATSADLKNR
jgi:phosphoglycerol transferase MdoB-like AlkP superfamily enzyme